MTESSNLIYDHVWPGDRVACFMSQTQLACCLTAGRPGVSRIGSHARCVKLAPLMGCPWPHARRLRWVRSQISSPLSTVFVAADFADGNCLNRTTFAALFVFADSGEYELHTCEQLGAVRPGVKARAHDLKLLMDKGRAEHGRQFVNAIAGKSD
jgi:hypothetical protein